jgi:hypothetical protein
MWPTISKMQTRASAIDSIRSAVDHRISARREMTLGVVVAGVSGLVTSFVALHLGLTRMAVRYPLAVAVAYAVFLAYLWLWLRMHGIRIRSEARNRTIDISPSDLDVVAFPFRSRAPAPFEFGQGGGFSGGGGGTEWGESAGPEAPPPAFAAAHVAKKGGASIGIDLDDGAWVLLVAGIAAAAVLGAAIYVVYIAPVLFAEMLLDAALAAGLYRRLRGVDAHSWWRTAIRRTIVPAVASALVVFVAGAVMQSVYPLASSIGMVWHAATNPPHSTH